MRVQNVLHDFALGFRNLRRLCDVHPFFIKIEISIFHLVDGRFTLSIDFEIKEECCRNKWTSRIIFNQDVSISALFLIVPIGT